jgi:hypothetical protein
VIGAGIGRTGTKSLSAALERLLGGKVYHSGTLIIQDEQGEILNSNQLIQFRHCIFGISCEKRKEEEKAILTKTPQARHPQMGRDPQRRHAPAPRPAGSPRDARRLRRRDRHARRGHDSGTPGAVSRGGSHLHDAGRGGLVEELEGYGRDWDGGGVVLVFEDYAGAGADVSVFSEESV